MTDILLVNKKKNVQIITKKTVKEDCTEVT